MRLLRGIVGVLAGIAVISIVVETLEFTLVSALAAGAIDDMDGYFAVRNQPGVLAAKVVYNTLAAVLGGYVTAKIAGASEMKYASVAASLQTFALIYGMKGSEYGPFTPTWMWVVLILLTGPAILLGAAVRAQAREVSR